MYKVLLQIIFLDICIIIYLQSVAFQFVDDTHSESQIGQSILGWGAECVRNVWEGICYWESGTFSLY